MQPFERKFSKSTRIFLLLTNFFFFLEQKVGVFIEGGGGAGEWGGIVLLYKPKPKSAVLPFY